MLNGCGGDSNPDSGSSSGGSGAGPAATPGLDTRPANLSCKAPPRPTIDTDVALQRAWPNISFTQPVKMLQAPNDSNQWYVLQKTGEILRFDGSNPTIATASPVLTVPVNDASEGGLLSMAFHPDYVMNQEVVLSYTVTGPDPVTLPLTSRITRIRSNDGGLTLEPTTESEILSANQPFGNHNGGDIAFGPDSLLYIGFGDGGDGGDPQNHGQDTSTLLGSMLRIDIDNGAPYSIPADNPFAGGGGQPEIFAWGFRNPWRWSFDRASGRLWAGDVGQGEREEIDIVENGANYGWRCYEGNNPFNTNNCADQSTYQAPVIDYDRNDGQSVTGGYVYRGNAIPGLQGVYVFADYETGNIWGLFPIGTDQYERRPLVANSGLNISSFGQGNDGELYVTDLIGGGIHRLVQTAARPPSGGPSARLSETGCVNPASPAVPVTGVIPYEVIEPFWSDGADKERFIALPAGGTIDVEFGGDMILPPESVLMKHFRLGQRLIETRLFVRHADGGWAGYTYEWNDAQTDADLLVDGKDKDVAGQIWHFPSRGECMQCHTTAANFSLGAETLQLNRDAFYSQTDRTANQLATWEHTGMFSAPLTDRHKNTALSTSRDVGADTVDQARSYLHVNCSQCHRPAGTTQASMDLQFTTPFAFTGTCNQTPTRGDLGIDGARLFAPGDPSRSVIAHRISNNDGSRMPPIASNLIDDQGVDVIEAWISEAITCDMSGALPASTSN